MTLLEKQRELRARAAHEKSRWALEQTDIDKLYEEFLPQSEGFCRFPKNCPARGQWCNCKNRCSASYWRDHNRGVSLLMEVIAKHTQADVNLYRMAGLVHDLDYLRFPHDDGKPRSNRLFEIHPMVEVKCLEELGAPAELLLALMEHAPHTGCKPSSPLSHALIAADNIATFRAAGKEMPLPSVIPIELANALQAVPFEAIDDNSTTQENRGDLGTQSLEALLNYHKTFGTLSDLIHGDRLVCLTGAGISLQLKLKCNPTDNVPDWVGLIRKLHQVAISRYGQNLDADSEAKRDIEALLERDPQKIASRDIIQSASILQSFFPSGEFEELVKQTVTPVPGQTTETHRSMLDLHPRGIITWNYDDAHETALHERNLDWNEPLLPWQESRLINAIRTSMEGPFLLKAHGSIAASDAKDYSIVLTEESYRDLFVRQPVYRAFLQHVFTNFNLLIVGFGMADPDFDLLLNDVLSQFGSPLQSHVLIRSASQQQEMKGQEVLLRRAYGIQTLYISDWSYLPSILRDAARAPGPKLRETIAGCLDHSSLNVRKEAHQALRQLGLAGRAHATQILLDKLKAANLSPNDESEIIYSLGSLNVNDSQVREFLLNLLKTRAMADRADSNNVETIAHLLSIIEPGLRPEDILALEEVLTQLSQWPDGVAPDDRLAKYVEAIICRLRAKFELWNQPRIRIVKLCVEAHQQLT